MDLVVKDLGTMQAVGTDGDISKFTNGGWWMEPKFDGFRGLVIVNEDGSVEVLTRSLKSKLGNAPHVELAASNHLPFGTILDGEFCMPKAHDMFGNIIACDFKATSSIMGSKPENASLSQERYGKIHYVVFDVLACEGKDIRNLPQTDRRWIAKGLVDQMNNKYIHLSYQMEVEQESIDYIITHGGEGVVIKNDMALYVSDGRPQNTWYKVKATATMDAVVVGFDEPNEWLDPPSDTREGTRTSLWLNNLPGAVVFAQYKDGVLTERGRCSGMELSVRESMRDNPEEWIGKVIEVKHYGLTTDACRHPQFLHKREDKTTIQCVWEV